MIIKSTGLFNINKGVSCTPAIDFASRISLRRGFKWRAVVRFFSDRKSLFFRNLTARHIGVIFLRLEVKELLAVLKVLEEFDVKFKNDKTVTIEDETAAYDMNKKFVLAEKRVVLLVEKEMGHLDGIIATLATKPDWINKLELKHALEELRPVVATFLCSVESLRSAGSVYLDEKDTLWDFPRNNKISVYCADARAAAGLLSLNIKKNLRYLSSLLKEIRWKWGWLGEEERELIIAKLREIHKEKKKIAKRRKAERKRLDKISKNYLRSFRAAPFKS